MPDEEKKTYICQKCGGEAELTVKEEKVADSSEGRTRHATLVCKICGSEADTIFEEI